MQLFDGPLFQPAELTKVSISSTTERAKLGVLYIHVDGAVESRNGSGWKFCSSPSFINSRDGKMSALLGNVCSDEEDVMKLLSDL